MVIKGKRAQFFILAAIIIVSIVVGLTVVKNYVTTNESPNKVFQYSEEFGDESGAIVNWGLINNPSGSNLGEFYNESISNIVLKSPEMEVYVCYGNQTILTCENWGIIDINISANNTIYSLQGGRKLVDNGLCSDESCSSVPVYLRTQSPDKTRKTFNSAGINEITIFTPSNNYTLDLERAVQSNQFYLLFRQNSTGGDYAGLS